MAAWAPDTGLAFSGVGDGSHTPPALTRKLPAVAREQSWTSRHRAFKGTRHPRLQICSLKVTEAKSSVSIFTQPHPRWGNLIPFKGDSVF